MAAVFFAFYKETKKEKNNTTRQINITQKTKKEQRHRTQRKRQTTRKIRKHIKHTNKT